MGSKTLNWEAIITIKTPLGPSLSDHNIEHKNQNESPYFDNLQMSSHELKWQELQSKRELYLKDLEDSGKSFNTIKNYRTDLKTFFDFFDLQTNKGPYPDLNLVVIEQYLDFLQKKYPSSNSRRRRVQTLRNFFDFLVQKNIVPENPIKKFPSSPKQVAPPIPAKMELIKKIWNRNQFEFVPIEESGTFRLEQLIKARNRILLILIYEVGLKVSDIESMKWEQVKLGQLPHVLVIPPKRDPYVLPIPPQYRDLIQRYQKELQTLAKLHEVNSSKVLFYANSFRILGSGLSARGIELLFEEWSKSMQETLTARSLRFSWVFHQLQQGIPHETIKDRMGVAPSYSLLPYSNLAKNYIFSPIQENS
jgi:site-specific recombinase XerD